MFFLSLAVLYILALLPSRACDHVTDGSSLSLFVCVCASQSVVKIFMCAECSQILKPKATMESESVEREHRREKTPRRVIHFSSGETMEEYSTDEEEEDRQPERRDLLSPSVEAGRSKMTWGPYFWFHMWRAATSTISACDYLGERMASLFGITSAKYQYAIDEYYKMKKEREEEEEEEENRLSEEAERSFDPSPAPQGDKPVTRTKLPAAPPHVTYKIQNESQALSGTMVVPAIVTVT